MSRDEFVLFARHASPEAIRAEIERLRDKKLEINRQLDRLFRLRNVRDRQIALGTWPVRAGEGANE